MGGKSTWQANLRATQETVVLAIPKNHIQYLKDNYLSVADALEQIGKDRTRRTREAQSPPKSNRDLDIFYES